VSKFCGYTKVQILRVVGTYRVNKFWRLKTQGTFHGTRGVVNLCLCTCKHTCAHIATRMCEDTCVWIHMCVRIYSTHTGTYLHTHITNADVCVYISSTNTHGRFEMRRYETCIGTVGVCCSMSQYVAVCGRNEMTWVMCWSVLQHVALCSKNRKR